MTRQHNDSSKRFTVRRDGDRDLTFTGILLGVGSMEADTGRGTEVRIYRTAGGRYVVAVTAWTAWEDERDSHRAAVCEAPEEVLAWLRQDAGGTLGPASKKALEHGASEDPGIAGVLTERVE